MIPTIGLMIGTYIIIRLVLCLIALIINIFCMILLWRNPHLKPPENRYDTPQSVACPAPHPPPQQSSFFRLRFLPPWG